MGRKPKTAAENGTNQSESEQPATPAGSPQANLTGQYAGMFSPEDFIDDTWIGKIYDDPKKLTLTEKTYCFHNLDGKGHPVSVNDARIYKYLTHTQHIIVCGKVPYIYMGGYYHMDLEGTIIQSLISDCLLEVFIKSTTISRIFKLFLQKHELVKEPWELNAHSGYYINFKNGMYDVKRRKVYPHSPKIFSINQVPWEYDPDADHGSGSVFQSFIESAIPDDDDREMFMEYAGLCCTIDRSQQKFMVISGEGGTGKSTIINLLQKIVGRQNISNVPLAKLGENFHAIPMMGKLMNSCADLEIDALDDVTIIKKVVGEDAISDSYKGKNIVSFENYAKMLFSVNELPIVRNEKTEAFYRRLLVLTMDRKPKSPDPGLGAKLENEIPHVIDQIMQALQRMYQRGHILVSENSEAKTRQLRIDSDTIEAFLEECCITGNPGDNANKKELYEKYQEYCKDWERQAHGKNSFYKALRNKGFSETKYCGERMFKCIRFAGTDENGFVQVNSENAEQVGDIPFDA